jgi:hypothetical protein
MDTTGQDITIQDFNSRDIVNKCVTSQKTGITYYYCDFSDRESLETRNILGTLIRELLEKITIPDDLEQQIDRFYRPSTRTASDDELISILCAVVEHFSKVYVCIDGLDECGKNEQVTIMSMVNNLAQHSCAVVKILLTSREEIIISTSLRGFPRLRVSADNNAFDIITFVEETVKSNIRSGALAIQDPSLESDIISELVNGARGMYVANSDHCFD